MDRRERQYNPEETLRMALESKEADIWTAMPAIIQSFDPVAMTCTAQPAINGVRRDPAGNLFPVRMPLLLDCPVMFPGGGGVTLTFPVRPGDECLVVFASRCIDSWWQLGGVQGQAEFRMHDLSDGFAFVGVRSQPRRFTVNTDAAQLRTDDGTAYVEVQRASKAINAVTPADINANAGGDATVTAAGMAIVTAPEIVLNGNVTINGDLEIIGSTVGAGINLNTHVHTGVTPGGGNSGTPL